jgi:hypothetical protein
MGDSEIWCIDLTGGAFTRDEQTRIEAAFPEAVIIGDQCKSKSDQFVCPDPKSIEKP